MTKDQIPVFDKLLAQMERLDADLAKLSEDAAKASAGPFRIKHINQVLAACEAFLTAGHLPFGAAVQLTEADGSNGDAALVVGQYVECLKAWRAANVTQRYDKWYWVVESPGTPAPPPEYVLVKFAVKPEE